MGGFGFLIILACFAMVIIALKRTTRLGEQISELQSKLGQLAYELSQMRQGNSKPSKAPKPVVAPVAIKVREPIKVLPVEKVPEPVAKSNNWGSLVDKTSEPASTIKPPEKIPEPPAKPPIKIPQTPTHETPKRDMEQALASRWFVWIGGVSIAIGGLLFVKYAYDNGYISPTFQIFLGLLLAAALIFAGDRLRRKTTESDYVPAALSAAGLATAFASIYAAYALYELVGPTADFIGLALVGLGALALSLRQGPLIAALGLLGSYVTPMMISSHDPSGWGFFPYLLVILGASFAVLHKRPWWWLGYASVAGSALWAFLWLGGPFETADILPLGLFALALGAISIFAISGRTILASETGSLLNPVGMTAPLKIGSIGIVAASLVLAALVFKCDHAGVGLILFFIGMACVAALSWFKQGDTAAAPAAALLSFVVLMGWQQVAFTEWAMDENGIWSSILLGQAPQYLRWMLGAGAAFTALGLAGVFRKTPPLTWAVLASGAALLFLMGAWGRVDGLLSDNVWALIGVLAAAALLASVWLRRGKFADEKDNLASGILAVGSAGLLLFAEDRMFDGVWLTIAMAALAAAYAFSTRALAVKLLGPISATFGSLTTLRLFISRELWSDDRTLPLGQHWPLYGYGIPVVLFYFGARWLKSSGHNKSATTLEGVSLGLAISLVSLELRVLIGGGLTADKPQLLEIAAHILTWLGAAYGLMYRQQVFSSLISRWGARILLSISVIAIVFGSLLSLNPVLSGSPLQGGTIFNALLLAYLAPAGLLWLISRKLSSLNLDRVRPFVECLAVLLVTIFVSFEIKRLYQGPLMSLEPQDEIESALHILAWFGLACGLVYRSGLLSVEAIRWSSRGLLLLGVAGVVFGSFTAYNPVLTNEPLHGNAVINPLLLAYLAPAGLLWLISRSLGPLNLDRVRPSIEGLAVVLVTSYVSLEIKRLYQGPFLSLEPQDELESALLILAWLGLACGLVYRSGVLSREAVQWSGRGLLLLGVAGIVFCSFAAYNPVLTNAPLNGNAVINSLLLAYLAPILLLGLIARKLDTLNWLKFRPALGVLALVLALTYLTLETKRVFQGPAMVAWSLSGAESYAYSAVWLVSALALFVAGIKLARQYIRYAGLGVMVLVVLKVFLWDMSGLEGLYRIFSFVGLGLCLVGIGWIYQRFVQKPKEMNT